MPETAPSADYIELIAQVNDLRIDREWQIKQIDKLKIEKDELAAKHFSAPGRERGRASILS